MNRNHDHLPGPPGRSWRFTVAVCGALGLLVLDRWIWSVIADGVSGPGGQSSAFALLLVSAIVHAGLVSWLCPPDPGDGRLRWLSANIIGLWLALELSWSFRRIDYSIVPVGQFPTILANAVAASLFSGVVVGVHFASTRLRRVSVAARGVAVSCLIAGLVSSIVMSLEHEVLGRSVSLVPKFQVLLPLLWLGLQLGSLAVLGPAIVSRQHKGK